MDVRIVVFLLICLGGIVAIIMSALRFRFKWGGTAANRELVLLIPCALTIIGPIIGVMVWEFCTSNAVDHEIFSETRSSLPFDYSQQKFWCQLAINCTLKGGRNGISGPTILERANIYRAAGEFTKAEHDYWGVLSRGMPTCIADVDRITKDQSLPTVDCVPRSFAGLGRIYYLMNKPAESELTYKRAIAMFKHQGDKDLLATTENNLAMLYQKQRKYKQAENLLNVANADYESSSTKHKDPAIAATIEQNRSNLKNLLINATRSENVKPSTP